MPGSSCNSGSDRAVFAQHMTWNHQAPPADVHGPHSLWAHQQQPACMSAPHHSTGNMAAAAAVAGSSGLPQQLLPQGWGQGSIAAPAPLQPSVAPAAAAAAACSTGFAVQGASPFAAAAQHTDANPAAAAAAWHPASSPSHALCTSSDMSAPSLQADTPTAAAAAERQASALLPPLAAPGGCKRAASDAQQGSGSRRVRQQRISKVRHEEEVTGLRAQVGTGDDSACAGG
jgi:hypothetical protein